MTNDQIAMTKQCKRPMAKNTMSHLVFCYYLVIVLLVLGHFPCLVIGS